MPGIDDFLKQYPELAKEDPKEVAEYVYETQIKATGASQDEFNEYFLGKQDNWFVRNAKAVGGMIKGNAAMELPNVTGAGMGNSMGVAAASMLGNDDYYANAILKKYPDHTIGDDGNGNKIIIDPTGKPKAYVNQPGLDTEDVTRFGAKAAAFVPAAMGAGAAAGLGLAARVGAGALGSAVTDAGMQKLSGREEVDRGQVAVTGVIGGAAEAIAPVLGKIGKYLKTKYTERQWTKLSTTEQRRAIARQLTADGFRPSDLRGMSRETLNDFGVARIRAGQTVSPEATIAEQEFGYRLTRGQMMPDDTVVEGANKFQQLSREETLRSTPSGERFRRIVEKNTNQTDDNLQSMAERMVGRNTSDSPMESAQRVQEGILDAERALKSKVDDAYGAARSYNANIADEAILAIPDRVTTALRDSATILDDALTPGAVRVMKDLSDNPETSIRMLDIQRQRINNMFSDTMDRRDKRALKIIKDAFDDAIGDAIDNQMFTGDPQALDALKKARGLYADYAKKFRSNDQAGKIVQKIIDRDAAPEEIANLMIGVNGMSKAGSARIAKRYGEIVGRDSEAFNSLREMAFLTITRKPTNETKGAQALVSTIKKALEGQGSSLMKELYTEAELSTLKRFSQALEATIPTGDFARSSGTAERMLRFYQSGGFRNLPFVDSFKGIMENYGVNKALMPPSAAGRPISVLPAAGAYSTSQ